MSRIKPDDIPKLKSAKMNIEDREPQEPKRKWDEHEEVFAEFNAAAYEIEHFSKVLRLCNEQLIYANTNPSAVLFMLELLEIALNNVIYVVGRNRHKRIVNKMRNLAKKFREYVENNDIEDPNDLIYDEDYQKLVSEAKDIHAFVNDVKGKIGLGIPTRVRESDLDKLEALL